jgi:hypothetical protein
MPVKAEPKEGPIIRLQHFDLGIPDAGLLDSATG